MSGMYHSIEDYDGIKQKLSAAGIGAAAFGMTIVGNDFLKHAIDAAAKEEEQQAYKESLNASLDKWSQPMRPGPDLDQNRSHIGTIMKSRRVNKSSKGKHPSNYTPPKKKRK